MADLICGNAFRDRCSIYLSYNGFGQNQSVKNNFIFVHTELLQKFFSQARIQKHFYLISNNSDSSVNESMLNIANHPLLVKWYAQNLDFRHPKVFGCPIGVVNEINGTVRTRCGDHDLIRRVQSMQPRKVHLVNKMMTLHHGRREALKQAGLEPDPLQPFDEYLSQLAASYFCISPQGAGIDCHRTWESLYLKTIPIILRNKAVDAGMFKGLPVIVLDSWDQYKKLPLSEDLYSAIWRDFDVSSLTLNRFVPELLLNLPPE